MNRTAIPWTLTIILAIWVFGLEQFSENKEEFDPTFEFYDTTTVKVQVWGDLADTAVFVDGQYNNILEGRRQFVTAQERGGFHVLTFQVNSPRQALIYVNDNPVEVFLIPGDTSLTVRVYWPQGGDAIDSVSFEGQTANICRYYEEKEHRFHEVNIRTARHILSPEDFSRYAFKLDSAVARELLLVSEQEVAGLLPSWFAMYEKNEILYHRAYLKLTTAYNRDVPQDLLDPVLLNNQRSVFSYYYYLYLDSYFATSSGIPKGTRGEKAHLRKLHLADSLLDGEARDVYLTRIIFSTIRQQESQEASALLDEFKSSFSSPRYRRFLEKQIEEAG